MRGLPAGWTTVQHDVALPQATTGPSSSATSSPGRAGRTVGDLGRVDLEPLAVEGRVGAGGG